MRSRHLAGRYPSLPAMVVVFCLCVVAVARADFLGALAIDDSIVQFSDDGARVRTFVSPGSGGLNGPLCMTWGPDGNLYVGGTTVTDAQPFDLTQTTIFVYDGQTGNFVRRITFPSTLPIFGVHFARNGDLLVSSPYGDQGFVYRFNLASEQVTSRILDPKLADPGKMLDLPDGRTLVGSTGGKLMNQILVLDQASDTISGVFAKGSGLTGPNGMEFGPDGMIYAANLYFGTGITRIDPQTGQFLGSFNVPGASPAFSDLVFQGDVLWASDLLSGALYKFDSRSGEYLGSVGNVSSCFDLLHLPEPATMGLILVGGALVLTRRPRSNL